MAFIRRKNRHFCMPPMVVADDGLAIVDGSYTDLWRCDDCEKLWQVRFTRCFPGKLWGRPSLFALIWYRHRRGNFGLAIFEQGQTQVIPAVDPWENSPVSPIPALN